MKTPIDVLAGGRYAFGNKKLPLEFIREDEGSRYVDTVSFYFCTDNRDNSGFWTRCSNSYRSCSTS